MWNFDDVDRNILFLIKTMKHQYLESTLKQGRFCFNLPNVFNQSIDLKSAQQDKYDSYLSSSIQHLVVAPIISAPGQAIKYGKSNLISDHATIHYISDVVKQTPLCSFRKVEATDIESKYDVFFFCLGSTVDRIKEEFGHDAFILIWNVPAFFNRLSKITSYFAKSIHYGDIDLQYQRFLDSVKFEQKIMFQKSEDYAWQKEFRIILPPIDMGPQFVEIGSIEDIAWGGDVEDLRQGYILAETEEKIKNACKKLSTQ